MLLLFHMFSTLMSLEVKTESENWNFLMYGIMLDNPLPSLYTQYYCTVQECIRGGGKECVTRASAKPGEIWRECYFWKSSTHLMSTTTGNHRMASIFSTAQGFCQHYRPYALLPEVTRSFPPRLLCTLDCVIPKRSGTTSDDSYQTDIKSHHRENGCEGAEEKRSEREDVVAPPYFENASECKYWTCANSKS